MEEQKMMSGQAGNGTKIGDKTQSNTMKTERESPS
jgi:hypothetical protein